MLRNNLISNNNANANANVGTNTNNTSADDDDGKNNNNNNNDVKNRGWQCEFKKPSSSQETTTYKISCVQYNFNTISIQ